MSGRRFTNCATASIALCLASIAVHAQSLGPDTNGAAPFGPPVDDQRTFAHGVFDQLEGRLNGDDSALRWDGEAWVGTYTDRLWFKSEGEVDQHGVVSDGEQEVFYDRPITPFFDVQAGARYDLDSLPGRGWGALGIEGLAPWFIKVSATAYASDEGHYAAKLMASYDQLLTQRLILSPEAELNFYSKSDAPRRIGSGLSDLDSGLRLRYEITRKFAPYIGVTYERSFCETADFLRAAGDRDNDLRFTTGLRASF